MGLRYLSVGSLLVIVIWRFQLPTYEFKCPKCQITIEQSFSVYSNHQIWCSDCQIPMEKQFTNPGVIFKGDGWGGNYGGKK